MARSVVSGPFIAAGSLDTAQLRDSEAGPSLFFQGQGIVDPRLVGTIDAAPGRLIAGFFDTGSVAVIDAVPSASAAGNLHSYSVSTVVPAGGSTTPVPVSAASQSIATSLNLPLDVFPPGPNDAVVTVPATLDFGFTTCTATAGQFTITIPAGTAKYFRKNQGIAIAGAGATATVPLLTWVTATPAPNATTVTIATAIGTSVTSQPVGACEPDLIGQPTFVTTTGVWPVAIGGVVAAWDASQFLSRCLRVVSSSASDTAFTVTVRGWDIYGVPMTETISVTAAGTAYGKKAWKYINTIQLNHAGGATTVGTITLGTGDTFGFGLRSDEFEFTSIFWVGAAQTANTGWLAADLTTPATATTGDVRGTVQLGVNGNGTGYTTSPNGTNRLVVFINTAAYNAVNSSNLNYSSQLGATQNAS